MASAAPGTAAKAPSGPTVRIGFQNTSWGAQVMVADKIGAWADEGVRVESHAFGSGSMARDGMLSGSLDAGTVGAVPFIVGASKGSLVAVAVAAYAGDSLAVVVRKDSPIKTLADLKGKKVGSQVGSSTNQTLVDTVAPSAGLHPGDYQLINIKFQDMLSALLAGQLDAFAGVDPAPSIADTNGTGRILTTYASFDRTPLYLVFTRKFIESHPDTVQKVVDAWVKVEALFKSDKQKVVSIIQDYFATTGAKLSSAAVAEMVAHLDPNPDFKPDVEQYLTSQANALLKQGSIKAVPKWDEHIDTSFIKKALAK